MFIVIPAYNEEKNLGKVAAGLRALYPEAKIVVVDDGSIDHTAEVGKKAGAIVLKHIINRGQGAALATGTEYALAQGADIIVHFDADGQFEAGDVARLIQPIAQGEVEVTLGSRFLPETRELSLRAKRSNLLGLNTGLLRRPDAIGTPRNDGEIRSLDGLAASVKGLPFSKRYLLLPLARLVNFVFTGVWLSDAHNGLRALSRRAAESIVISQDRMAHNSEIVAQIKKRGLKFIEVPVTMKYYRYGQGLVGGLKIVKDLILRRVI